MQTGRLFLVYYDCLDFSFHLFRLFSNLLNNAKGLP